MHFNEHNSPNWLIMGALLYIVLGGASALKVLFSDLRPAPNVHNETTVKQDIKIETTTDCKFSLSCSGNR